MRLDKFVADNTELTRKDVRKAAKQGEICVNGGHCKDVSYQVATQDKVTLFGQPVVALGHAYLMFNKPAGCVCANKDNLHPTALDVIAEHAWQIADPHINNSKTFSKLQIVGRLDIDTTGLLLITTDGEWHHRITSPKHQCGKIYHVTHALPLSPANIQRLEQGIKLKDDPRPTGAAKVQVVNDHETLLTIYEGRFHQVKRMFAAVDNEVTALHRRGIGGLTLDPDLEPGQYRHLTQAEIDEYR